MKRSFLMVAAILALSSCAVSKQSTNKNADVVYSPVVTEAKILQYDIDFTNKAVGTADGVIRKGDTKELFIDLAIADAITKSGCDFLFEPTVQLELKGGAFSKVIHVTVNGYPAKYTSTKNIDMNDSIQIKYYNSLKFEDQMRRSIKLKNGGSEPAAKRGFFGPR